MNIIEKTVKALEKLRSAKNVTILMIKMSRDANSVFADYHGSGYVMKKGKKYVESFSNIDVFIDPGVRGQWVQIYYKTPVATTNTFTIQETK